MKYRKLRIAWSVACGVACLMLVVLWVRSYGYFDAIYLRLSSSCVVSVASYRGSHLLIDVEDANRPTLHINHYKMTKTAMDASDRNIDKVVVFQVGPLLRIFRAPNSGIIIHNGVIGTILVGAGLIPWLRWQFSLRTLLIGMTVAAIGLGLLVYMLR